MCKDSVIDLYERHARAYDRDRSKTLQERAWIDRFLKRVPPGGSILDIGCGSGEPIARHLIKLGYEVTGVDSSPSMIKLCRERFPDSEWFLADMRNLKLNKRYDGVLAWDSFFHLCMDDQREMFARFTSLTQRGAPLMFTAGPTEGESVGHLLGEPLYHASLNSIEYERLLTTAGFVVRDHMVEDKQCGNHTVWLATYQE